MDTENNTRLTTPHPKSSSGNSAFTGRIFVAARHSANLLLAADVRNKKARTNPMRAL
jgi:hypothetical protein